MATRLRGPAAGFGWLGSGIGVGFRHPKPLFGGAGVLFLTVLGPILISLFMQFHARYAGTALQPSYFIGMAAAQLLVGLLILPLYAGYLQVIDDAEQGQAARAGDVFKVYRDGKALPVIGYGIVAMVIYCAMFAIVLMTEGSGVAHWYVQAITAQANHLPPPTAALPGGFWTSMLLFLVIGIFMLGFYAISLGQIALGNRSVFGAIGDGFVGTLKNLLPLVMLMLGLILTWIVVAIFIVIAFLLLALIGKLVGAWLLLAVIIPLYIAFFLVGSSAMFGVMYHIWLDVCGDHIVTGAGEPLVA